MEALHPERLVNTGVHTGLFALLSLPQVHSLTAKIGDTVNLDLSNGGCPTQVGVLAHGLVLALASVAYQVLKGATFMSKEPWMQGLKYGALFVIFANPMVYKLTNSVFQKLGLTLSDSDGCPSMAGIGVHSVVFGLAAHFLVPPLQ